MGPTGGRTTGAVDFCSTYSDMRHLAYHHLDAELALGRAPDAVDGRDVSAALRIRRFTWTRHRCCGLPGAFHCISAAPARHLLTYSPHQLRLPGVYVAHFDCGIAVMPVSCPHYTLLRYAHGGISEQQTPTTATTHHPPSLAPYIRMNNHYYGQTGVTYHFPWTGREKGIPIIWWLWEEGSTRSWSRVKVSRTRTYLWYSAVYIFSNLKTTSPSLAQIIYAILHYGVGTLVGHGGWLCLITLHRCDDIF